MAASHGHRSVSVNGWPERILATFAWEWKLSPSANSHPRAAARPLATVVFPEPDTPTTTTRSTGRTRSRFHSYGMGTPGHAHRPVPGVRWERPMFQRVFS